jgi:hypothetical protein
MPTVKVPQRQIAPERLPGVRRQEYAIPHLETPPPKPLPNVNVNGAQFGQAITAIGEDLYAREKEKQDQVRVLDAKNQLGQAVNTAFYDPKTGALNTQGQAALGLHDTVLPALTQTAGKIRKTLSNDRQRIEFDAYSQGTLLEADRRLNEHVATEARRVDDQNMETFKASEIQAGLEDPNPMRAEQAAENLSNEYQKYGERHGIPQETTDLAIRSAVSQMYVAKTDRYLDQNQNRQAKVYYDEHQDDILGSERGRLEIALNKGTLLGQAQEVVDTLKQKYTDDIAQTDLEAEIPKLTENPEVRQHAEELLDHWFTVKRQETRFKEQQAALLAKQKMDQFEQSIKNTMDRADRSLSYEQVVPQSVRDQLPEPVEKAQREYWKMITEQKEPKTDERLWRRLRLKAVNDPDGFAAEDIDRYYNKLSRADYKELTSLQADMLKHDKEASEKKLKGIRTIDRVITESLQGAGIDTRDKANDAKVSTFWQKVEQRVYDEGGMEAIDMKRLQQIADEELIDIVTEQHWYGDKSKKAFELTPADIPAGERQSIQDELRAKGLPTDDQSILDQYRVRHKKK